MVINNVRKIKWANRLALVEATDDICKVYAPRIVGKVRLVGIAWAGLTKPDARHGFLTEWRVPYYIRVCE